MDAASEIAVIESALAEVTERLRALATSPRVRELRTRASSLRRAVETWSYQRPNDAQRTAMLECVMDLHRTVLLSCYASPRDAIDATPKGTMRPPEWKEAVHSRTTRPPPAGAIQGLHAMLARTSAPPPPPSSRRRTTAPPAARASSGAPPPSSPPSA